MKIIPNFQKGGAFDSFFTLYTPIETQVPKQTPEKKSTSGKEKSEDEKGKLTEKDFFSMIKDIDGLPNEMNSLVNNLINTFNLNEITGESPEDLATLYLKNLYQIKILSQNKKKYDDAVEQANKNGSLAEPAITMDGKLIAQDQKGSIVNISLDKYFKNQEDYYPLSVSQVANLRAYSSTLENNQSFFNIITNSMGFESFQTLLDQAKIALGSSEYSQSGMFNYDKKALDGLKVLSKLSKKDQKAALKAITSEGTYKYSVTDQDNIESIKHLINYLSAVLPNRAKIWASFKLQNPDKNKATQLLISNYLLGRHRVSHDFDIDLEDELDDEESKSKKTSKGTGSEPKEGIWRQIQINRGGEDSIFNLMIDNGRMFTDGKLYGTTPGLDHNQSLNEYISTSGIGYLLKNSKSISFGDIKLDSTSFNDVMIYSGSGAFVATLPAKPSGEINFDLVPIYTELMTVLRDSGLDPSSKEYQDKKRDLFKDSGLDLLIDPNTGNLNLKYFGNFLILEGAATSRARGYDPKIPNKHISIKDIPSKYNIEIDDYDENEYNVVGQGLSNKQQGDYKIDHNNIYDWNGHDLIYKGLIYIPLNTNPLNGMNADGNSINQSTSKDFEQAQQDFNKIVNMKSNSSTLV